MKKWWKNWKISDLLTKTDLNFFKYVKDKYNPNWLSSNDVAYVLDVDLTAKTLNRWISSILKLSLINEIDIANTDDITEEIVNKSLQDCATIFYEKNNHALSQIFNAFNSEYSILDPYSFSETKIETESRNIQSSQNSDISVENSKSVFNTDNGYLPTDKQQTQGASNQNVGNQDETKSNSTTWNRKGRVGNMTNQSLIIEEFELRKKNIYDYLERLAIKFLTLDTY